MNNTSTTQPTEPQMINSCNSWYRLVTNCNDGLFWILFCHIFCNRMAEIVGHLSTVDNGPAQSIACRQSITKQKTKMADRIGWLVDGLAMWTMAGSIGHTTISSAIYCILLCYLLN